MQTAVNRLVSHRDLQILSSPQAKRKIHSQIIMYRSQAQQKITTEKEKQNNLETANSA